MNGNKDGEKGFYRIFFPKERMDICIVCRCFVTYHGIVPFGIEQQEKYLLWLEKRQLKGAHLSQINTDEWVRNNLQLHRDYRGNIYLHGGSGNGSYSIYPPKGIKIKLDRRRRRRR